MGSLHVLAVIVLGFEMPVPVFWLILHTRVGFWRRHVRLGYLVGILGAWGIGDCLLYYFRKPLFHGQRFPAALPQRWALVAGLLLIAKDIFILILVEMELGGRRLVGHAELTGSGKLAERGLYKRIRHPRYLGMMAGVMGGCFVFSTRPLWILGALWFILALIVIRLEERELRLRFGSAYADYARRVPALWPFHFRSGRA